MYRREGQAAMNQRLDKHKTPFRIGRVSVLKTAPGGAPIGRAAIPLWSPSSER